MAKISHPRPASTQGYLSTSRKNARSASTSLESITKWAPVIMVVHKSLWLRPESSLRLHGLRDHHLALEVLDHIWIKPHRRRLLGQGHGVDLVLQLEQRIKKILRTRRAARDINIRGDNLVHALQHGVSIERPAHRRARAHRDHPLRIGHLVVDALYHRRHLQCHRAGHNYKFTLPRRGTDHLPPTSRDIEARGRRCDHLDRATGQSKRHRPYRRLARPVENIINRADHEILFELVLQPAHGC